MQLPLIASEFIFIMMVQQCLVDNGVASVTVGLYGPDRYEGLPEVCLMPMDMGYCRAKVKRYYFDIRRMKCSMFYWGGCAGNDNNFNSNEDCNEFCVGAYDDTNRIVPIHTAATLTPQKQRSAPLPQKKQQVREQLQRQQKLRDYDFIENNSYSKYASNDNRDRSDTNSYGGGGVRGGSATKSTTKFSTKTRTNVRDNAALNATLVTASSKNYQLNGSTKESHNRDADNRDKDDDDDDDYEN